jgi:2',3'-cyclic-nucleotide 2'-phosphodiesterase/3'-nucleotidase
MTAMTLRILATSDLHAHLMPWDYSGDCASPALGLALTAGQIAQARAEVPNALLFDNGDFLQGSLLGDFYGLEHGLRPCEVHPVIAAMNHLNYDAVTLGNHEFSHGLDFLNRALAHARFPITSANIRRNPSSPATTEETFILHDLMIERELTTSTGTSHQLRIGVFGLCPTRVVQWESEAILGRLTVDDLLQAGQAAASDLRARGADIIIALSHSGIWPNCEADDSESGSFSLATRADVDVIIAGHTHHQFPDPAFQSLPGIDAAAGTIAGKPTVMPGCFGSHLGVIDLALQAKAGRICLAGHTVELRPTTNIAGDTTADAELVELVTAAHHSTVLWAHRPVGLSNVHLCSHFAPFADTAPARLLAEAMRSHLIRALGGEAQIDLPVLAASATFRAGGRGGPENYINMAPGPISIQNLADIYPHPNTVVGLRLTGAELSEWIERSASQFCTLKPGATDQPLIDEDFPAFNCDMIHGLHAVIDLSRPAGFATRRGMVATGSRRVVSLHYQGRAVAPADVFILATSSYRAGGGGGFPATGRAARIVLAGGRPIRSVMADYLSQTSYDTPRRPDGGKADILPPWSFAPLPGTSALFDTSAQARADDRDVKNFQLEDLGIQAESGCRRFRLWF